MLQQHSSVPARLLAALRKGPLRVMALALAVGVMGSVAACGQKGPLSLREGQQLQRPPVRPVTSPAAPPALSPTDSPAVAPPPPLLTASTPQ